MHDFSDIKTVIDIVRNTIMYIPNALSFFHKKKCGEIFFSSSKSIKIFFLIKILIKKFIKVGAKISFSFDFDKKKLLFDSVYSRKKKFQENFFWRKTMEGFASHIPWRDAPLNPACFGIESPNELIIEYYWLAFLNVHSRYECFRSATH